mmetsp:Transcript_16303/g.45411  ORF Transcript_16303/g.45411 Transcript_16303/m.45411 type:complete len:221 (+) Transcript_16303:1091-1753(+)
MWHACASRTTSTPLSCPTALEPLVCWGMAAAWHGSQGACCRWGAWSAWPGPQRSLPATSRSGAQACSWRCSATRSTASTCLSVPLVRPSGPLPPPGLSSRLWRPTSNSPTSSTPSAQTPRSDEQPSPLHLCRPLPLPQPQLQDLERRALSLTVYFPAPTPSPSPRGGLPLLLLPLFRQTVRLECPQAPAAPSPALSSMYHHHPQAFLLYSGGCTAGQHPA